jgi:iron complex outermembrane receptor protein
MKFLPLLLCLFVANAQAQEVVYIMNEVVLEEAVIAKDRTQSDSMKASGYKRSTDEMLNSNIGISLINRAGAGNEIQWRGVSSDRLDISINGIRLAEACTDKMDPVNSYVNSFIVASIQTENVQNPAGSGNSGRIDLELISPSLMKPFVKVRGIQQYESASSGLITHLGIEKGNEGVSMLFAGGITHHDNYKIGGGSELAFSQYHNAYLYHSAKVKIGKSGELITRFLYNRSWDLGFAALPMDVSLAEASLASIDYQHRWKKASLGKTDFKIYHSVINHVMNDSKRPDVVMHMDMPGKSSTSGFTIDHSMMIARRKFKSSFAATRTYQYADMTMYGNENDAMFMLTWPGVNNNQYGLSSSYSIYANEKRRFVLTGGGNINHLEVKDPLGALQWTVFVPREKLNQVKSRYNVAVEHSWFITKNVAYQLELGRQTRIPTASELFGFYLFNRNDGFDYIGNPNLTNESRNFGEFKVNWKKNQHWLRAALFGMLYKNYILGINKQLYSAMTPGAFGVRQYENIGDASIIGFETEWQYRPSAKWKSIQKLTYKYARSLEMKEALPLISPLYFQSHWSINQNGHHLGATLDVFARQNQVSKYFSENETPGYLLGGIHYRKNIWKNESKSLEFSTNISNIFDVNYHSHTSWNDIPSRGRNITMRLLVIL